MASSSATVKNQSLPLNEGAIIHTYWVYFHLQESNTIMESTLDPKDWGWWLKGASLVPVMTNDEPAPEELLKIIRCNC